MSERKLSIELDLPENLEWNQIHNLAYQTTLDTNHKYFQYKTLNRILETNIFLTQIRIENDKNVHFANYSMKYLSIYSIRVNLYRIVDSLLLTG